MEKSDTKTEGLPCTPEEWNQVMTGQRCLRCGTEHIEIYPSSGKAMCLLSGCDWKINRHGFVPFNPPRPEEGLSLERALNYGLGIEPNDKTHGDRCSSLLAKEVIRLREILEQNVKVDSAMESLDVPRLDRASENPSEVTGSDGPCNPVGYDVQIDPCVGESFEGHAVNVVGGNLRKITEVDRSLS